ncbi:MAG: murein hydrolase activator EnvC [Clostridiaceae bacterium]
MNKRNKALIMGIIISNLFSSGVLATELEDAQNQSSQIEQKITDGKNKLDDIKKNKDDVTSQIAFLDQELGQAQLEVDQLNLQIQNAEIEKKDLDEKLDQLEEELGSLQNVINQRFRKMYMDSGDTYIELLFNSKNISDLIDRMEIIKTISNQDKKLVKEFEDKQEELNSSIKKIEELKEILSASKEKYDNRLADLRKYKDEKDALLQQLNSDINAQEAMLAQQEEEYQKVNDKINQMKNNSNNNNNGQGGNALPPVPTGDYYSITGGVRYQITSGYTLSRVSPVSGRIEKHEAIDIGAPYGSGVYSLKAGVIAYSGWMTGYGNVVIVDHGDMRSLYAHNSVLSVSVGQSVTGGQKIAEVGSTGWSTGPHIHFEISINGQRIDPTNYYK